MADAVSPDDWTPAVWSHAAVMDMQARLAPAQIARYADDWQLAVDRIRDVLVELDRQVAAQVDRSWHGRGADASISALRRYVADSLPGLTACRSVAVRLSEVSRAASDLRACITPPAHGELATERLDEALAQVRQLYSGPAVAAGNAVEEIPGPPEPFEITGRTSQLGLPTAAAPAPHSTGAGQPPAEAPLGAMPSSAGIAAQPPAPNAPLSVTAEDPMSGTPTHSAALSPPVYDALPVRSDAPVTTPGPQPGGVPPTVVGQVPSVGSRAAASPFTPFLGGMYPGLMGRGADGGEHPVPAYLVSAGNAGELIGELPLVAPPVIGE